MPHRVEAPENSRKWWVLASVACGTFMATLDSSIVNIALPTLTKDLSSDLYQIKWVVMVYLLVITCLLLPFGRLSDQTGRKRMFQLGYLIFVIGSALCSVSPSLLMLVLARGLQGVGASMLMVNGPAIITAAFPHSELGAALGTLAMVVSAGLISGPSLGGFLISTLGWRSIFWVNIPIGIAGIALVYYFVASDMPRKNRTRFDWGGAILQVFMLSSLITLFDPPRIAFSGSDPIQIPRWGVAIAAAAFSALFLKIESEARAPIFDFYLLKNRTFSTAICASFLVFIAFSSVSVLMPFFLEESLGMAPHRAGIFMSAIPLVIFIVAPISGRLSDRFVGQGLSLSGALIAALTLTIMSGVVTEGIQPTTPANTIVALLSMIGLAMGLFQSPNNNAIMGSVQPEQLGAASALLATVRNLGLVIGTGLATGMYTWRMAETHDFIASLHTTLFSSALVAFGAMFACLGKKKRRLIKNGPQAVRETHAG